MKPLLFVENEYHQSELDTLRKSGKVWRETDCYIEQLEELFDINNPNSKLASDHPNRVSEFLESYKHNSQNKGTWVYYPWSGNLVHILNKTDFNRVINNRNRNIITEEEQSLLSDFTIGVVGLSIGNGMALSLAHAGFSKNLRLADFDLLSLSNLNRIRTGIQNIGQSKLDVTLQEIYEMNPYSLSTGFPEGLSSANLNEFLLNEPRIQLIFEAVDDFEMKIRIRIEAKKAKVPVVMLTNLGDSLLVDIERYDTDDSIEIFNGLIGDIGEEILSKPITEEDKQKFALAIVNKDNVPKRVIDTIGEINKTVVGRPQVMSTVTVGSGVASWLAKKIALKEYVPSGRFLIPFDSFLVNR